MSIFTRLFKPKNTTETSISTDDPLLQALLGDTDINRDIALSIPSVSSAVDTIVSQFALVPVKLYKRDIVDDKEAIREVNDYRVKLINDDTGDTLSGYQFKRALATDYLMGKGGYAVINRSRNRIKSLHYVRDDAVNALKNADPVFKRVEYTINQYHYQNYELIKLLRNTKDGAVGVPLTQEVSKAIETAYRTLEYQKKLVKTGGNKRGFLKSEKNLSKEAMAALKSAWQQMYAESSENCVILNGGIDFKEASNSSTEMQINETMQTLSREIDKIFHIDTDMMKTFKKAVLPICENFVNELNRVMLLEKEKDNMFFACDYTEILKPDTKERYEAYKIAKQTGWLTINEIRKSEKREEVEGLDVIPLSLGNVLFDVNTSTYYTPNTGEEYGINAIEEDKEDEDNNQE